MKKKAKTPKKLKSPMSFMVDAKLKAKINRIKRAGHHKSISDAIRVCIEAY